MADKYEEMARQMRADGVSEKMIARFVAEEMEEDEFRRSKGVTEIEALREWKKIPEHIRKLLLANAFCHNCGTTEFAPGYTLRMRHGRVLVEGCCTECGAEVASPLRLAVHEVLLGIGSCWMSSAPGNRDAPNRWANPSNEKVRHYHNLSIPPT